MSYTHPPSSPPPAPAPTPPPAPPPSPGPGGPKGPGRFTDAQLLFVFDALPVGLAAVLIAVVVTR